MAPGGLIAEGEALSATTREPVELCLDSAAKARAAADLGMELADLLYAVELAESETSTPIPVLVRLVAAAREAAQRMMLPEAVQSYQHAEALLETRRLFDRLGR